MSVRASESVLRIPTNALGAMWGHARATDPHEACGIVTSSGLHVPIRNVAVRSLVAYQFDVAEQLAAWNAMTAAGETLNIIYHSHTNTDSVASSTDHALAAYPDAWYVILSTRYDNLRAHRLVDGRLREFPYELCLA